MTFKTREEVALQIHWYSLVWGAGLLNPLMILPQLYKIWATGEVASISLSFLLVLVFLQSTFSLHGFFTQDKMIMWSNGGAAFTTALVILSIFYFN
jgi:uncharacterized protein with PQ loop repeat